jgi:hypothetical protein
VHAGQGIFPAGDFRERKLKKDDFFGGVAGGPADTRALSFFRKDGKRIVPIDVLD